jgi:hypothetical protein
VENSFHFDLHLFDLKSGWEGVLAESLRELSFARVHTVEEKHVDLGDDRESVSSVGIRFLTPMELKAGGGLAQQPDFAILAARIRDRVSTLSQLYGEGPLEIDFRGFGERAAKVAMTRCDIRTVETLRRSGRTGQTHSLGGFIGEADYSGSLGEFIPYLRAAQWTGVGRQTTWGKGAIALKG